MAELTRANAVVDGLIQISANVIRLMRQLRQNVSARERAVLEDQVVKEFEAGLYQGGVPPGMVPALAHMLATNTVKGIRMVLTESSGDGVVVYFLCNAVQSLCELGQMITSGFMHDVFSVAVDSVAHTTVDVYVKAEELSLRLSCLTSPQKKGLLVDLINHSYTNE